MIDLSSSSNIASVEESIRNPGSWLDFSESVPIQPFALSDLG